MGNRHVQICTRRRVEADERRRQDANIAGMANTAVGTQLSGIYELDERIAFGGMGEVYRGHNIQTGDHVAIKIVLPEFARDQTILSLFRKEASILNRLSHDAIVRYHVFTIDPGIGRPYLAMEFVDGESLFDVMRRGAMPTADVRKLCHRLASGLSAVHRGGRDTSRPLPGQHHPAGRQGRPRKDHRFRHRAVGDRRRRDADRRKIRGKIQLRLTRAARALWRRRQRAVRHLQPGAGAGGRLARQADRHERLAVRDHRKASNRARPVRHRRRFSADHRSDAAAGSARPAGQHGGNRQDDA